MLSFWRRRIAVESRHTDGLRGLCRGDSKYVFLRNLGILE